MAKWDCLVIGAGSEVQARCFDEQLRELTATTQCYAKKVIVLVDEVPGIGSGFATAHIAEQLLEYLQNERILLIHAGGFSKRLPHIAPFGKIFAHLPDGKTLLEHKLITFRHLPALLEPGLFVSASDTVETLDALNDAVFVPGFSKSMAIFAHYSSIAVGTGHGVFVLGDQVAGRQTLKTVLQKPNVKEMREAGAISPDGKVLTDSCYFLSANTAQGLAQLIRKNELKLERRELCCYGDFMRPIGTDPDRHYIDTCSDQCLRTWRQLLFDYFRTISSEEAVIFGEGSDFYHFGTPAEFLHHISPSGNFSSDCRIVASDVDVSQVTIAPTAFVEFCHIRSLVEVSANCLVSGIRLEQHDQPIQLPESCTIITWRLTDDSYATIIFSNNDDVKTECKPFVWFNQTFPEKLSIFTAPICPVAASAETSLLTALQLIRSASMGKCTTTISLQEAIRRADVTEMMLERKQLLRRFR